MVQLIKNIFGDIFFMYRNFFHWNFSKILLSLASYLMGMIFALPFLIIGVLILWFSPFNVDTFFSLNNYNTIGEILNNSVWFICVSFFLAIGIVNLVVGISYAKILIARLNLHYISRKKLKYKKNSYFDFKLFLKFYKITAITFLILLIPVIFFGVIFIILFFVFGQMQGVQELLNASEVNPFTILSFILVVIASVVLLYLLFRFSFGYLILVEKEKYSAIECLKTSFKKTKKIKTLFRFIIINLLFLALYLPFSFISQYVDYNANNVAMFISYKNVIGNEQVEDVLSGQDFYNYSSLELEYANLSDKELVGKSRFLYIMQVLYYILSFIFIYGIYELVFASFYKRELLKK